MLAEHTSWAEELGRGWCFASVALLENLTAGQGWCRVECYGQMAPSLQGLQKAARLHPSPAGLLWAFYVAASASGLGSLHKSQRTLAQGLEKLPHHY